MPLMPESDPLKPELRREVAALRRELRALQTRVVEEENPGLIRNFAIFSYHSTPAVNDASGGFMVTDHDSVIQRIDFTAKVAGSTSSTLTIRVNGTAKHTMTIAATATKVVEDGVSIDVEEYDVVSVNFTGVGSGLEGVVIRLHIVSIEGEALA